MDSSKELCGVIPVNKPKDWTSFDVVAKLRGIVGVKRLGHSGTLDPMATGVLAVFVGKATKACDMVNGDGKCYVASFRLGLSTDTQDITGEVLERSDRAVTRQELEEAAMEFQGDIMQIPPMFSAVKVGGKRLYELAREGKTVERAARKRHIDFINITEYDENTREGKMYVSVSSGTYIRTLIHDIGVRLGAFGTMTALERVKAGGFVLSQCYTMKELQIMANEGRIEEAVKPLDREFMSLEKITLSERNTPLYKNGVKLRLSQVGLSDRQSVHENEYRVYDADGGFISVAKADGENDEFVSLKNFY